MINPEFFLHEGLAKCSPEARLLFISLWTQADREGRLRWIPIRVLAESFPHEPKTDVQVLAAELEKAEVVRFYLIRGRLFAYLPGFTTWQRPHRNEAASKCPEPPEGLWPTKGQPKDNQGSSKGFHIRNTEYGIRNTEHRRDPQEDPSGENERDQKKKDQNKRRKDRGFSPTGDPEIDSIAEFLLSAWGPGSPRGSEKKPPTLGRLDQLASWVQIQRDAYPGIDILSEARSALAWESSQPQRKKTQIPRFLSGWFRRAQDRGGSSRRQGAASDDDVLQKARSFGAKI